jgi:hypothetical protein
VLVRGVGEDARVHLLRAFEVEGADPEDAVERHIAADGVMAARPPVHGRDPPRERGELLRGDQVGLVEQDDVGEGDLLLALAALVEVEGHVAGIHDRDHRVQLELCLQLVIHEEGLDHGRRIGEASGLDQHMVEAIAPPHEGAEDANEIAPHRAADAPIVHLEDLFLCRNDEVVVDAYLAELVLDDGDPLAVVFAQDAVQERGLARAQKPGEDGDRTRSGVVTLMRDSWQRPPAGTGRPCVGRP